VFKDKHLFAHSPFFWTYAESWLFEVSFHPKILFSTFPLISLLSHFAYRCPSELSPFVASSFFLSNFTRMESFPQCCCDHLVCVFDASSRRHFILSSSCSFSLSTHILCLHLISNKFHRFLGSCRCSVANEMCQCMLLSNEHWWQCGCLYNAIPLRGIFHADTHFRLLHVGVGEEDSGTGRAKLS